MTRFLLFTLVLLSACSVSGQRVGVVLSGGGATALSHIGVLKALEENDIPIDYIAGSSMGALVGAMYASGYSPAQLDSLFRSDLYQLMARGGVEDRYEYYFKQDPPDASMLTLGLNVDTTLQMSLPTNLRSPVLIDFEQMGVFAGASAASGYDMDSLFVPFRCVASDITARKPVIFDKGDLALAVRASMSYPFYFKPIRINGHLMMDGGMYNNFPSDVLYDAFMPDYIIGSNVAYNAPTPDEDDLMGQLKLIMTQPTNYDLPCEHGVIIEPDTRTGLFDFTSTGQAIQDGYEATLAKIPEIREYVHRRRTSEDLGPARGRFRQRMPAASFGAIHFQGLNKQQALFAERLLDQRNEPITFEELKPRYFRLYADHNIRELFPRATYVPLRGNFDLALVVKRERQLEVQFGGVVSSRPISTGMIAARYNLFGRTSNQLELRGYLGKFYNAGRLSWRTDLSSRTPLYIEPVITLNRWDHFSGFTSFFQDIRPSYIVRKELWGGANIGMGMGNKGLIRLDGKYAQHLDSYYQSSDFDALDTADVTEFKFGTVGLLIERNSLNRKQHPNRGEHALFSIRYVSGSEHTVPGSQWPGRDGLRSDRGWLTLRGRLNKYFLPRGLLRFGALAEGVYSTQPFFENHTATLIQMPVFQPTPESLTYFMEGYRAPQYLAGGLRAIVALARNKFDLRLEGYVFQPYRELLRLDNAATEEGPAIGSRQLLASGSLIYQTPLGPLWFNTSYMDGLADPWVWSLNFGYVIFAQGALQ